MARNEAWGQRMCGQYSNDQFDAYFFSCVIKLSFINRWSCHVNMFICTLSTVWTKHISVCV